MLDYQSAFYCTLNTHYRIVSYGRKLTDVQNETPNITKNAFWKVTMASRRRSEVNQRSWQKFASWLCNFSPKSHPASAHFDYKRSRMMMAAQQ